MQYCRSHVKHLVLAVLTVFRENWNMQLASLLPYISKDLKPFPRTLFSSLLLLHPFVCIFSFIIAYMLPKNWNRKQKKRPPLTSQPFLSLIDWLMIYFFEAEFDFFKAGLELIVELNSNDLAFLVLCPHLPSTMITSVCCCAWFYVAVRTEPRLCALYPPNS